MDALAALLTPEQWTAALPGVALILTAIGTLLTAIISGFALRRSGKVLTKTAAIEATTNGTARSMEADREALRREVARLKGELVEQTAERVIERLAAQQAGITAERAATDVREAREKTDR